MHAITPYIDYEHIKGRDNVMTDSLSRLETLGLYETSGLIELEREYGKFIFDTESEIICDVDISQHSNKEFEFKGIKYLIDEKELDDFSLQSTDTHSRDTNPSFFKCSLDMTKVKQ